MSTKPVQASFTIRDMDRDLHRSWKVAVALRGMSMEEYAVAAIAARCEKISRKQIFRVPNEVTKMEIKEISTMTDEELKEYLKKIRLARKVRPQLKKGGAKNPFADLDPVIASEKR